MPTPLASWPWAPLARLLFFPAFSCAVAPAYDREASIALSNWNPFYTGGT